MTKATKEQMIRREKAIQKLMAEGADRNTILETVAAAEGITTRAVEKQYYQIIASMQELVKEQRHELRANLMARQEAIFQKAMAKDNLKTALEATNAQAKLGGLYDVAIEETKRPEAIIFKEKDFSNPLQVVPDKAENE